MKTPATTSQTQSAARRARNRSKTRETRTRARPVYPGRRAKTTRRCSERRMFFTPDKQAEVIHNFVGYCLAHVANKYDIQVHACVFMSNHHHTDITDPNGNIVRFTQQFHSLLARGINILRKRFDGVWSRDKPCNTLRALGDEALDDLVYTLTNPVAAGLVKWGHLWPGFTTYGWKFGETRTFERPSFLFDPQGGMPATVELTLKRPQILHHLQDDELFDLLMTRVRAREKAIQTNFRQNSRRFVGLEKIRRQQWDRAPRSFDERFAQTPHVAASSKWLLLAELQRDRVWEHKYAAARHELLNGHKAVFPTGTYWLRHQAGVTVEGRGPPPLD